MKAGQQPIITTGRMTVSKIPISEWRMGKVKASRLMPQWLPTELAMMELGRY